MAKASKPQGIRPKETLGENARRVIEARLRDVLELAHSVEDPELMVELHDLRIAAKRLRYSLEIFEACFPGARQIIKEVTALQEDIGEIHDLDVLIDLLRARLKALEAPLEGQVTDIMALEGPTAEKSRALRRLVYAQARDQRRLGLLGLIGDKAAERRSRFGALHARWGDDALPHLARKVEAVIWSMPVDGIEPSTAASGGA